MFEYFSYLIQNITQSQVIKRLFYIINVSMLQFQEGTKFNRFAQEIRARKNTIENDGIEPFRSHRKQPGEESALKPLPQYEQSNIRQDPQTLKLHREYLAGQPQASVPESKKKIERFKYDLSKLTQSITSEQMPSKFQPSLQNSQNRPPVSKYCTSIKKCNNVDEPFTINRYQRNEVKSIIFDSKVEPFDSRYSTPNPKDIEMQNNREIHLFKEKVDRVNSEIAAGISNLEKMIERLKQKKVNESIMKTKLTAGKLESPAIARQTKAESKEEKGENVEAVSQTQTKRAVFFRKKQSPLLVKQQQIKNNQQTSKKQNKKQLLIPSESQAELAGDFKSKMGKFPPEYTAFVNRLAHQIQIDMQFTNMVSEISKNGQLAKIKDLIVNEIKKYQPEVDVNESFFQIEPSEIDPLQLSKPYIIRHKEEDQSDHAMKVFKKYKEIQTHFDTKLKNKFESAIIQLLFEDLAKFNSNKVLEDSKAVTIGHLLSYLNMRTNRSFRNRFFVKMTKRLDLKLNTGLTPDSFQKFIL